jgi:hypothetical protein
MLVTFDHESPLAGTMLFAQGKVDVSLSHEHLPKASNGVAHRDRVR